MNNKITFYIPSGLKKHLDKIVRHEGISRSDIIRESLRDYIWTKRFRGLRRHLVKKTKTQGIYTDRDVFREISSGLDRRSSKMRYQKFKRVIYG